MPKYTVIMPAKNSEMTVGQAIRSLRDSLPKDSEIALWDDGSDDRTVDVALEAGRGLVRVFGSGVSVGGGAARQNLLALTDSKYLINMDSDDISLPWRFKVQLPLLERAKFCFSNVVRFRNESRVMKPGLPISYTDLEVRTSLAFHNVLSHPTLLADRSALENVGGYSAGPVAQDYELWLRAAAKGATFARVGLPCVAYRLSVSQVSQQPDYVDRILKWEKLFESYRLLLLSLVPPQDVSTRTRIERLRQEEYEALSRLLQTLIRNFRQPLRSRYQLLLSKHPGGPFVMAEGKSHP